MNNIRFMIYADGGSKVCLGHIMRMMTLAKALRENEVEVIFATSSVDAVDFIKENRFECVILPELDYAKLADIANDMNIDGIIVDKFGFTNEEHQLLRDRVGVLVHIDDFTYDGPADLIINSTVDERPNGRQGEWLCGGDYALIRPAFCNHSKSTSKVITDILITTGYGDPSNMHLRCIKIAAKLLPDTTIHVVVGGGYTTVDTLNKMSHENDKIKVYKDLFDLSELMHRCDLAISSAGTTLYELAAAGVPTVTFSLYDNQLDNIARVSQKGCVIPLGWHEDVVDVEIVRAVLSIAENTELRANLSSAGNKWIDGNGADRIAKAIVRKIYEHNNSNN